jgi:predicted DNA-binding protein with PD1-like motif
MQSKIQNDLIFIRLFTDEDLYENLKIVCKKYQIQSAVVLSGIGQLKNFELGFLKEKGNYTPQKFSNPYELLNLSGIVSEQNGEYKFHFHAILGGEDKKVIGGHLINGIVETTNEIVLMKSDAKIIRRLEKSSGLEGLFLESPRDAARGKEENGK